MKRFKQIIKYGIPALALTAGAAHADILTDSQTALQQAGTDALTVGGYVVAAVAGLVVVGMILSMLRKAS